MKETLETQLSSNGHLVALNNSTVREKALSLCFMGSSSVQYHLVPFLIKNMFIALFLTMAVSEEL